MFATPRSVQSVLRWLRRVMTIFLIVSNLTTVVLVDAAPAQADAQPSFPIRAAFYYPWFPEGWKQQGFDTFTNYTPSLGFYDGKSQSVIKQQIAAMQYGGIQAGIASWWGQGSQTDVKIPALLQAAAGTNFRWSVYYENESQGDPSADQLTKDLTYLRDKYGNDPSFLRINGRFVVFVYADGKDACGMAERWKQANTVGAYLVLKVFSGYRECASQPDGWHQYSPAVAADHQKGYSYSIAPGFWQKGQSVRLARDLNRWNQNIKDMIASGAPWQLITTFNEWGEGTSVESAEEWASSSGFGAYLDALHNNGNVVQTQPTTVPSTQTAQPTATAARPTSTAVSVSPTSIATLPASTSLPASPTAVTLPTFTASPTKAANAPTGDPVIAVAGDIACSPGDGNFNGGDGTTSACRQKAVSDLLVGTNLTAVLTLGDNQYEDGALTKFQQSFDPSWGRVKNIIHPAAGNHEYQTAGASGYYQYFGAAAGDPTKGYYSYDIGTWHIIALNSNCSQVGGCGMGSPQEQWLKADLSAHPNACTLAYWHHPRFSSGDHGNHSSYDAFWKALYAANVEVVLNGHDHDYERFAPQNPSGAADPNGIQEFVVGTGGKNHYSFGTIQPNSLVRNSDTYGVLKLTLHPTSYDWQFVPEAGKTFTDSGTRNCVGVSSTQPTASPAATKTVTPVPTSGLTSTAVSTVAVPTSGSTATAVSTVVAPTSGPTSTVVPTVVIPTSAQSSSGRITFKPVADAYVTAAIPNTNYGGSKMLRFDNNPVVKSYLTFNVQGVAAPIASVKLRIYANSSSSQGCHIYIVSNNSWGERSITYNNAPPPGNQIGSTGGFRSNKWIEVDVTALVTGNGTFSLMLVGINSTAVSLASRESGSHAPQLIVTMR
jgi:hypothetical protein